MSVIGSNILAGASGQGGGYNLTKSLRFRSSANAYLNRTPASAGNRQKWTWSGWVKRGALSSGSYMDLFTALSGANDFTEVRYHFNTNDDTIVFTDIASGTTYAVYSTNIYRDPSAWYHIVCSVDTTQATNTNRVKLYVNGVQVTQNAGGSGYPLQNTNTSVNATVEHRHGGVATYGRYFDGYMAEINLIDGQALTPSSFGETSTTTGVWIPKKYTGTYGTNGFYLPFTDTTSTSTLGTDFSGNSNTWTVNNISLTSGSTYDSMTDVPTLTSATTANYAVLNPVSPLASGSITNANLTFTSGTSDAICVGTFGVSSGKWYWEITATNVNASLSAIGIIGQPPASLTVDLRTPSNGYCYISNGNKGNNNSTSAYGATYASGDVIGVALDMDAGTLVFYKNNSSQGTAYSSLSGTFTPAMSDLAGASSGAVFDCNFGQRPFSYTPPTGFVALNTFNLPTPTIGATASTTANKYFDATLYTGNGSTQTITGVGFQPDFTWIKGRSVAADHYLADAVRGATKQLISNSTAAEATNNGLTAFTSNGFSVGAIGDTNTNAATFVAWNWKANGTGVTNTDGSITSTVSANTTAGFSIVTWTGNGTSGATVGHGLGVTPSMVILKSRSSATNWQVKHSSLNANQNLTLNTTDAVDTAPGSGYVSAISSSTLTLLNGGSSIGNVNGSGDTYVAYCFAPIAGYSAFGSYTGNGSTDGTFVFLGFRPRFIMTKAIQQSSQWFIWDSARSPFNASNDCLFPESSQAETANNSALDVDFLSNGFKIRNTGSGQNNSGYPYIYMAFAEVPQKFSNAR